MEKYKPCKKCRKCYYGGPVNIGYGEVFPLYSCDYFILTGARRPCPAGADCTVYSPRSKTKRTAPNYTPETRRRTK